MPHSETLEPQSHFVMEDRQDLEETLDAMMGLGTEGDSQNNSLDRCHGVPGRLNLDLVSLVVELNPMRAYLP
jgi:hypothetical protein